MVHFDICNAPVENMVKSVPCNLGRQNNGNSLECTLHIFRGPCFNRQNLEIFVAKTILGKLILCTALDFHVGSSRLFSQNSFFSEVVAKFTFCMHQVLVIIVCNFTTNYFDQKFIKFCVGFFGKFKTLTSHSAIK